MGHPQECEILIETDRSLQKPTECLQDDAGRDCGEQRSHLLYVNEGARSHCGHIQGRGPRLRGCGTGSVQGRKVFMNFRRVRASVALEETGGVSPGEDLRCPWRALRLSHECRHRGSISAAWSRTVHGAEVDLLDPKWQSTSPPGSQDNCTVLPSQAPSSKQESVE